VAPLKAAVNPKDSLTGKKARTTLSGVPTTYSSSLTIPLLWLRIEYTPPIASAGAVISHKKIGSYNLGLAVSSAA